MELIAVGVSLEGRAGKARTAIIKEMIEKTLHWFDDPRKAEEELDAHYRQMAPQERLDEMVALLNRWGKWNERRLERIVQIVEVPRS